MRHVSLCCIALLAACGGASSAALDRATPPDAADAEARADDDSGETHAPPDTATLDGGARDAPTARDAARSDAMTADSSGEPCAVHALPGYTVLPSPDPWPTCYLSDPAPSAWCDLALYYTESCAPLMRAISCYGTRTGGPVDAGSCIVLYPDAGNQTVACCK